MSQKRFDPLTTSKIAKCDLKARTAGGSPSAFVLEADIPEHTAKKMIKKLRDSGLFRVLRQAKGRESAVVAFRDLLNITEGREVF